MDETCPAPTRAPTRVAAVMSEIRARIGTRRLAPGARLPSVRDLAASTGFSKSTVVEAYDRMVAEGTIAARRGAGFYVAGAMRPLALRDMSPDIDRAIDPLWITRLSHSAGTGMLKPGWGSLPAAMMPDASLQKTLRRMARDPDAEDRIAYGSPLGFAPLRHLLARRLGEREVGAEPNGIMLTDSTSHGVDLTCRLLLEPGDAVLVDDPCYFNHLALLTRHRAKVIGVPYGADGPDLAAFGEALATHRPRLYLTTAGLHNPTGATLSAFKAHRLLKLAEPYDLAIVEDDSFADLEPTPAPRLAGFDGLDRVVLVGSYSKTVSSSVRCGYMAARPDWLDALVDLKLSTSLGGGHFAAALIHGVLTDGTYRRHVEALRARLARAMTLTLARSRALGLVPLFEPGAGMFVWVRLPDGIDAADVARSALDEGVLFAPGNVFSTGRRTPDYLRLNVARCAEPRVFEVLARAMRNGGARYHQPHAP